MSTLSPIPESMGAFAAPQTNPETEVLLPASFQTSDYKQKLPSENMLESLEHELSVWRLNVIGKHLWMAGRPVPARPLQRQVALGRTIIPMEQVDLHLLWFQDVIYLKPLPRFLLSAKFWREHLVGTPEIYGNALGLLTSYVWLIGHETDFAIAKDKRLVPFELTWSEWLTVVKVFLAQRVNPSVQIERYRYSELRLQRINAIYRFIPGVPNQSPIRGYYYEYYTEYSTFFQPIFAWASTLFAVVTIVFGAMQVGLQTSIIKHDDRFQKVCYGFAVSSLIILVVILVIGGALFAILLIYNLIITVRPIGYTKGRNSDTLKVRV